MYETRFLSVIISSKLNWNAHIDTVLNKISKTIGIIAKVRHLLPTSATRTLYLCLVEPYISYCNIVWAQSKPTTQLDKILRVQKKYCRLITFADYRAHSEPLFKQLLILNVYKIHIYQLSLFMYKQLNKLLPSAGTFSFQTNSVEHSHFTRQSENVYLVRCRTQRRLTTVLFQGPRLWNSLPSRLKKSPSVNVFKRLARVMLLAWFLITYSYHVLFIFTIVYLMLLFYVFSTSFFLVSIGSILGFVDKLCLITLLCLPSKIIMV